MIELTQEIVHELLHYEPNTGKLFWKERDVKWFKDGKRSALAHKNAWNAKFANKEALASINNNGYRHGHILSGKVYAHRVIWLWMTGEWPKRDIDHINGDPADNRWKNLRDVSHQNNSLNQKLRKTNKSGTMGVHWCKRDARWIAKITVNRDFKCLGYFTNKIDAIKARKEAEIKYGFHPNHGRRQSLELT